MHMVSLIKMTLFIICMSHFIACTWHILQVIEYQFLEEQNTWVQSMGLIDSGIVQQYIACFYWSVSLIMLIGTGGQTFIETIYCIITLLLTVGVFAYTLSTISTIIEEINKEFKQYKKDLGSINRYMCNKSLSKQTQSKVRSFIEYLYLSSNERNTNIDAIQVIEKLPENIKTELQYEINSEYLQKISFFNDNFSVSTIQQITNFMQEDQYVTNQNIFNQNQYEDLSIYLITKGSIELIYNIDEHHSFKISTLKEGQFIGDKNFIQGTSYEYTARCQSFTTVCKIRRKDFLQVIKENQEDQQKFHMIKEQIIFDKVSVYHYKQCNICKRSTHSEFECNLINYRPNLLNICLKHQYTVPQLERSKYYRREIRSFYSLDQDLINYLNLIKNEIMQSEQHQNYINEIQNNSQYQDESSQEDDDSDFSSNLDHIPQKQNNFNKIQTSQQLEYSNLDQNESSFKFGCENSFNKNSSRGSSTLSQKSQKKIKKKIQKQYQEPKTILKKKSTQFKNTIQEFTEEECDTSNYLTSQQLIQNENDLYDSKGYEFEDISNVKSQESIQTRSKQQSIFTRDRGESQYKLQKVNPQDFNSLKRKSMYHPTQNSTNGRGTMHSSNGNFKYTYFEAKSIIFKDSNDIKNKPQQNTIMISEKNNGGKYQNIQQQQQYNLDFEFWLFFNFETMQNWKVYCTQNNLRNILNKYNYIISLKNKKQQKKQSVLQQQQSKNLNQRDSFLQFGVVTQNSLMSRQLSRKETKKFSRCPTQRQVSRSPSKFYTYKTEIIAEEFDQKSERSSIQDISGQILNPQSEIISQK